MFIEIFAVRIVLVDYDYFNIILSTVLYLNPPATKAQVS